ncbi:hypothetical protein [Kordia zhangzhouensis]|uniref:hypothetical protein n=1 Tax=Kordia zhangzhouensis TaxID=1620405 RepID=UPI0012E0C36B|nr:hypothetical protein [Kordia zhangzhouensis]
MKKNSFKKIALNKKTISIINGRTIHGGALPSNYANHGNYSDVPSELVTLPVATNCPTDTFELSCICGGAADDTKQDPGQHQQDPIRNR